MAAPEPVWVIDTSSLIELKSVPNSEKSRVVERMTELVNQGRLVYPKEVLGELKRRSGPSDLPLKWARENQGAAVQRVRMETVRAVLSRVPDVLDSTKTSGPEEADPYVLAWRWS